MSRGFRRSMAAVLAATIAAPVLVPFAAKAQESNRIRSTTLAEDVSAPCENWAVDFPFERCERLALPDDPTVIGQSYTLSDGGVRTLTVDPGLAPAATTSDMRTTMTPVDTATESLAQQFGPEAASANREATGNAIAEAAIGRDGSPDADGQADQGLGPSAGTDEGTDAPGSVSAVIEENFVLPPVVASIPGRTEIMPMAMGHLNRIETPFADPMVRSSAAADAMTVEFDQNFVYVSLTQPVTLFIHEKGFPDPAVVVSLVPQRIAPRQVRVTLPSTVMRQATANAAKAEARRSPAPAAPASASAPAAPGPKANSRGVAREAEPRPATNTVAHVVQSFSRGELPPGFMSIALEGFDARAFCSASGVRFSFRQGAGIASNDYIVVRGMAEAGKPVALSEQWCARHPQTLAVAFAPRTRIGPDQPSDFYVMIRRPQASIRSARQGEN